MDQSLKNKTLKIFEDEQNQLKGAFESQSPDIKIPKTQEKISFTQRNRR